MLESFSIDHGSDVRILDIYMQHLGPPAAARELFGRRTTCVMDSIKYLVFSPFAFREI